MKFYSRSKFASKRKSPKRRAPLRKKGPNRQAIKREVARQIARNVEDKDTQYYNLQKTLYSVASATFQDNVIQVGPNNNATEPMPVFQGTGVASRIGNKIKTKKLMIKGTLTPLPYDGTTNAQPTPVQVRMLVLYDRSAPTSEPQVASNLFQNAGANAGFYNDLTDLWRPYNTDKYRILTQRTFKLGYAENTALGAIPSYANMANNDFKLNCNFKVDLTKYYPKIVKFDENSGDATTRGLWVLFYYCSATGGAIAGNQALVNLQWMVDYKYEDA